jgi:DNA-binding LacI/PurR family transcriptional regulator
MKQKRKPLYLKIREQLREEIQAGKWKCGQCIPTEIELSQYYSVSRFTVRQAILQLVQEGLLERISGRGTFVREAKASRVAREQQLLGVVLPYQPSAHTGEILKGIERRASQLGMRVVFINSQQAEDEGQLLIQLLTEGVCGLIYYCSELDKTDEIVMMLKERAVPFVFVDRYPVDIPVDYVATDNFQGSYEAMNYLLRQGYRKIAFVSCDKGASTVSQRMKGYVLAHTIAGLTPAPSLCFVSARPELTDGELEKVLAAKPDAIFTTDLIAVRLMNMAFKRGIEVPQQLALIGFDNSPIASLVNPPLTTVEQPTEEMGVQAVNIIAGKLAGDQEYVQLTLPTRLVVRSSCIADSVEE